MCIGDLSLRILINRDTDIAMFEALFVTVKEVLLKPFFTIFATHKISRYLHGHNSIELVLTYHLAIFHIFFLD